jgi:hypothetical protein
MIIRKKIRRKRDIIFKYKALFFFLLAGLCASIYINLPFPEVNLKIQSNLALPATYSQKDIRPAVQRLIYPYSVIPGGVYSDNELALNMDNDPVVAAHYADFNVSQAKIIHAPKAEFMYVSYRIKNKIFWTSKKVKILEGESLITDGKKVARARCGNMVSASTMTPVSLKEPEDDVFEVPSYLSMNVPPLPELDFELLDLPNEFASQTVSLNPVPIPIAPVPLRPLTYYFRPQFYRPLFSLSSSPIPEPATFPLLAIGLCGFLIFIKLYRK